MTVKGTPKGNPVQQQAAVRIAIEQAIARGEQPGEIMDRLGCDYRTYLLVWRRMERAAS